MALPKAVPEGSAPDPIDKNIPDGYVYMGVVNSFLESYRFRELMRGVLDDVIAIPVRNTARVGDFRVYTKKRSFLAFP